jgi:hypothetical protein
MYACAQFAEAILRVNLTLGLQTFQVYLGGGLLLYTVQSSMRAILQHGSLVPHSQFLMSVNNQLVRIILGVPFVYPAVMPAHIVGGLATFGTYMGIKAVFATGMLAASVHS